jgi:hypothetical protein
MNLVERVKGIILSPRTEWPVIEREPGGVAHLFPNYVAILAAIPAVAALVGNLIKGAPLGSALLLAVVSYLMAFVFSYLIAMIINILAPRFGGIANQDNALKLSVYSATPFWLAGVFGIIPGLSFLTILGLYGLYLLYAGATPLMRVPPERSIIFTVVVFVCTILAAFVLSFVLWALFT